MRKYAVSVLALLTILSASAELPVWAQSQSADQTLAARQAAQRAQLAKVAQQLATQLQAQAAKSKLAAAERAKAAEAAKATQAANAAKAAEAAKLAAAKAATDAKAAETARADAASKAAAAAQADASASAAQSAMAAAERAARQELALRAKFCSLKCVAINQMSGLQDLTNDLPRGDIYTITETMLDIKDRQAKSPPIAMNERPKTGAIELKGGASVSIHFTYPTDATPLINGTRRIFGIDISHYNSASLFQADLRANNIAYVYAKATQGTSYKDATFTSNWETLGNLSGSHKLHRGAYHFLSAPMGSNASQADNGAAQAKTLVDFLNLNGGLADTDVRPMLDVEADLVSGAPCNSTNTVKDATGVTCYHDRWADVSKADMVAKINAFMTYMTSHTCYGSQSSRMCPRPVIYTNNRWFADKFGVTVAARFDSQLPKDAVWLARYYDKPWPTIIYPSTTRNQAGWQFSQSAVIATSATINPHYISATDSDVFMGSPADFAVEMSTTALPGD